MNRLNHIVILSALLAAVLLPTQAQELLNYPLDTVNGEEVYRYQVEKSIGLYRVGVNFNVSQSEIIRFNPQLKERGLHYGETLLIPTGRPVIIETKPRVVETTVKEEQVVVAQQPNDAEKPVHDVPAELNDETVVVVMDSAATDSILQDTILPDPRKVIELALMLPFESQQTKRSGNAERMMEFYQGALLALRDLQNDSTLYRLRVYDTERSERKVNELCDSTELDSVKAILGLVYPIQIERMAAWCEIHKVPLMLPFSDDVDLAHYSQLMQFNSTDQQEADSLCAWMAKQENSHFVAIEVREADIASSIRTLRKQMKRSGLNYSGLALRDLMNDSAAYALDNNAENIIILHSDRYQHIRILLPHIAKLQEAGYRIRIVSQYSWQKEKINLPQVYTSMFTVEDEHAIYDAMWSETYKNEHVCDLPRYDLLGYDLMKALVLRLQGENESTGMQSQVRWQKVGEGGYQNECVKVVVK